ncbi:MAG: hypothetical protein FJX76_10670 [Armatimonadetes bacterium]|nr:hypothetical protein [Armatimonadota bacterium]
MALGCGAFVCLVLLVIGGIAYEQLLNRLGAGVAHVFLGLCAIGVVGLGIAAIKLWKTPAPEE